MSKATPTVQPAAQTDDQKFATFLGEILDDAKKNLSPTVQFFAERLREQRSAAQQMGQTLAQGEQQLANLKSQALKLEGQYEQGVASVRHFWEQENAGTDKPAAS